MTLCKKKKKKRIYNEMDVRREWGDLGLLSVHNHFEFKW